MWDHFTGKELTCKCGCGQMLMRDIFMKKIVRLRRLLGFPFIVTSAYRCPEYNDEISNSGRNGAHTTGKAIDISVSHEKAFRLLQLAPNYGITGIGINQKGKGRFIHLDDLPNEDTRPRPMIWSYP